MIRLRHPNHGEMNVDTLADAEVRAPAGWFIVAEPAAQADNGATADHSPALAEPDASPVSPPVKRRGRPPKVA